MNMSDTSYDPLGQKQIDVCGKGTGITDSHPTDCPEILKILIQLSRDFSNDDIANLLSIEKAEEKHT